MQSFGRFRQGLFLLVGFCVIHLSGCGKADKGAYYKAKDTLLENDASKSLAITITLTQSQKADVWFEEIFLFTPQQECSADSPTADWFMPLRILGSDLPPLSPEVQAVSMISFRKSFELKTSTGSREKIWVDFVLPLPLFGLISKHAPSDHPAHYYAAILALALPVPHQVSTYFFAKNHLISTDAEFFMRNRTYLYHYLENEYPHLHAILGPLPDKNREALSFLGSWPLTDNEQAIQDHFLTFWEEIPTTLTLSLFWGCQRHLFLHGIPPPCEFLHTHLVPVDAQPLLVQSPVPGILCPVIQTDMGSTRVVWDYPCVTPSPPTCPDVTFKSFDPNTSYLKYHLEYYTTLPDQQLFCPSTENDGDLLPSLWCSQQIDIHQVNEARSLLVSTKGDKGDMDE